MNDSQGNSRTRTLKVLATIAELYPHSSVAKKLDGGDDRSYESLIAVWSAALDGITPERIAGGLKKLLQGGSPFEPSVPEFVALCRPTPAAHRRYTSLPRPRPHDNRPASIDHYPQDVQHQLTRIGMVPKPGETHHDYCQRCRQYVLQSTTGQAIPVAD